VLFQWYARFIACLVVSLTLTVDIAQYHEIKIAFGAGFCAILQTSTSELELLQLASPMTALCEPIELQTEHLCQAVVTALPLWQMDVCGGRVLVIHANDKVGSMRMITLDFEQ
jgi:hypothetical protein